MAHRIFQGCSRLNSYLFLLNPLLLNSSSFNMTQDLILARLLANNDQWAEDVQRAEPGFFQQCAKGQAPKVLWIGCADSRVPESVLTACKPGEIFVHRNIANQFHPSDDSALAVLTYAVDHVGVSHVIVVGHTNCGGAAACHAAANDPAAAAPDGPLGRWLGPLTDLAKGRDLTELVEANVRAQVANLANAETLKSAWERGKDVQVHGWVYEIETGRLRDLGISVGRGSA
ncbi:Carbonic anhydrase 2 [Grifola frondosa]|uniref:Carbonic anhydrase n=1 Tax=Grifola frondosa TaxID=5627 RepID=A0A1C7MC23_GRIFR|nr:Carbonic anhydrase 2 [Grifola frondosa]